MLGSIDIFFLHIPKTAGRSFNRSLRKAYGNDSICRLHWTEIQNHINKGGELTDLIPQETKVLNGHIKYAQVSQLVSSYNLKVILWFRDPIERLFSNYAYYLYQSLHNEKHPSFGKEKGLTFIEYCRREECRNLMTKFTQGLDLKSVFYLGLQKHYSDDLERLSTMLDVPLVELQKNINQDFKRTLPEPLEEDVNEVLRLNTDDVKLYEEVEKLYYLRWN